MVLQKVLEAVPLGGAPTHSGRKLIADWKGRGLRTCKEKEMDGNTDSTVHKSRHEEQLTKSFHKT